MVKHIFFDKSCVIDRALADRSGIEAALKNLKIKYDAVLFVNQIHSAEICVIDHPSKIHGVQNLPKADAIITNLPNLVIAVVTADCAPILLHDDNAKIIAAIHAGWRGARSGIILNAIIAMEKLGAKRSQIIANIGPMIHQKSYEVGQEFYDEFLVEAKSNVQFFQQIQAAEGLLTAKYLFNLPNYVKQKLQQAGIKNIQNCNIDTYENHDYASYRRATHLSGAAPKGDMGIYGRNISAIVID